MKKSLLIIMLSVFLFLSCKKEEIVTITDGEKVGMELKQLAKDKNITKASISVNGSDKFFDKGFTISGHFIIIENTYYNLEQLQVFTVVNLSGDNIFELYF